METEPVIIDTVLKPKRKYTKKEGVKYGRPKKVVCNGKPEPTESPKGHQE